MGKLLEALKQECEVCGERVFAIRIIGKYIRTLNRILIWECPECHHLWQNPQRDELD